MRGWPLMIVVAVWCCAGCSPASSASAQYADTSQSRTSSWPEWEKYQTDDEIYELAVSRMKDTYSSLIKDFPTAKLVRWVKPDEWAQTQVDCMNEKGFKAFLNAGGVGYASGSKDQKMALNIAAYECETSYPSDPRINLPMPQEQLMKKFDYLAKTVAPCIQRLGKPVKEIPSFEQWSAPRDGDGQWDPYSEIQFLPLDELNEIYKNCPSFSNDMFPADLKGK